MITSTTEQFKSILALEKQLTETDAILSSYKDNINMLDEMKKSMSELERTLEQKDSAIQNLTKQKATRQSISGEQTHIELTKENIELKEMLKFSEDELKRVTEEKKHALDELLKQSVKGSNSNSRKRLNSQQQQQKQQTAEDTYDGSSQQSPEKSSTKRKESPQKAVGRSQRSAKKAQQPPATVEDEDEQEQSTHDTIGDAFQIELHDIKQQPLALDTTEDVTEDTEQLNKSPRKRIPSSSKSRNTPRGRSADILVDPVCICFVRYRNIIYQPAW